MKAGLFREDALVFWAAKRLGRPVRWASDRSEAFLSDDQARDVRFKAALALDGEGNFLALQIRYDVNVGAYLSGRSLNPIFNIGGVAGVYRTPLIAAEVCGVFTNTIPTAPYRGAGRPEATFAIERLIDVAAGEIGIDPIALRRRNLIPADGDAVQDRLAVRVRLRRLCRHHGYRRAARRSCRACPRARPPPRGAASCAASASAIRSRSPADPTAIASPTRRRLLVHDDGTVHLFTGAMSVGQGLETAFAAMVAAEARHPGRPDRLSSRRHRATREPGAAAAARPGSASAAAPSLSPSTKTIEIGRMLAADHFEAAASTSRSHAGHYAVAGTDRSVSLADIAGIAAASDDVLPPERGAERRGDLPAAHRHLPQWLSHLRGRDRSRDRRRRHRAQLRRRRGYRARPQPGPGSRPDPWRHRPGHRPSAARARRLRSRVGATADRQLHGLRHAARRRRPARSTIEMHEVPTRINPLGAKGVGEAGTVGALAATINAVCDALSPLGVRHIEMPATPERVWAAIRRSQE